jgi:hypothetical protein
MLEKGDRIDALYCMIQWSTVGPNAEGSLLLLVLGTVKERTMVSWRSNLEPAPDHQETKKEKKDQAGRPDDTTW